MIAIDKTAETLFDKIRSRFAKISIGDENAKSTLDPSKARFFNFDYVVDGENYGNITISIVDELTLKVYFDKEVDNDMPDLVRYNWYKFLKSLRQFAMQNNFDSFDIRDIAKSGLNLRDLQHANKDADVIDASQVDLAESKMYGTSRSSYQKLENVRIIARHSKPVVDENIPGARSRNIECFYVENSLGERFRLPEGTTLNGARAYARYVKNGGAIHDEFGQHIGKFISEMESLKHFARNMRGRQFEDVETQVMVEAAIDHYGKLHRDLHSIRGQRGYQQYRELWTPEVLDEDDFDIDTLKERFVKRVFDDRLMDALPIVHRAYKTRSESVGEEFEAWANGLEEDSSPLSKVENPIPYTTQHPNFPTADSENDALDKLLTKWNFEFQVQDGAYYFTGLDEIDRAENVILSAQLPVPKMGIIGKNNTHGASMNDRDLSRMSAAVHEAEELPLLKLLAGLTK